MNLDASGPVEFMLFEVGITTFPVSSFDESLAELRLSSTHAIRTSEEIVKRAYTLLGSSSIFKFNDIQRYFQDILAISQQVQGRMSHYETVGSYYINSKLKKMV